DRPRQRTRSRSSLLRDQMEERAGDATAARAGLSHLRAIGIVHGSKRRIRLSKDRCVVKFMAAQLRALRMSGHAGNQLRLAIAEMHAALGKAGLKTEQPD